MSLEEKIRTLRQLKERVRMGGGPERVARHHEQNKLAARERIEKILDPGSFEEINALGDLEFSLSKQYGFGDGIVTGHGKIDGRLVCIFSQDATIKGGSVGAVHRYKMSYIIDTALKMRVPMVALNDSAGERIVRETHISIGSNFYSFTQASGIIPQITAILGNCAGNAVYGAALTDFIFMVDGISRMTITGPRVVKEVTGEDISLEDLGGARVHARISGCCDFRCKSEEECFQSMRKLMGFLPSHCDEHPPRAATGDDPDRAVEGIQEILPVESRKIYDMHRIIEKIVDMGDFLEVKREWAQNLITGFARLHGYPVGIVANQPRILGGALTVDSSDKQARFIRFCDSFNIPIVFLMDVPGYFPGKEQEYAGIIRHGAKVLYAISEATTPMVSVIIRKAYGGGVTAMAGHLALGPDRILSWPTGEIAVMSPEATVEILFREDIQKAEDPAAHRAELIREYEERFYTPYYGASALRIHDVIEPADTRRVLIRTLELLRGKKAAKKMHGNIPL